MGDVILDRASTATADFSSQIERDLMGFEIGRRSGGISVSTQRDKLGRPIEQTIEGITRRTRSWKWGTANQLLSTVDSLTGSWNYTYNAQGFLTFAESSHFEKIVRAPDAIGNLFKENDRSDRTYGKAGQLLSMRTEKGETKFEYDPEGNLTKKSEPNGRVWNYSWNGSGMMSSATRPDGTVVEFSYDPLGRRLSKTFGKKTTRWVWDGNILVHELTAVEKIESPVVSWLFEDGSLSPVAELVGENRFDIVTDHLGTPVGMYDARGSLVWHHELSIWGDRNSRNAIGEADSCPFRYPGQYEDIETGLYYNRFRYFDPELGQYTSVDPIGLAGGNPTLFGYVGDPNDESDTYGLKPCGADAGGTSRNAAYRAAKREAGIPNTTQGSKPVKVYDTENRIVQEFSVDGKKKYIVEHREDKFGRGPHFHGADDQKGSPLLTKVRYYQYSGHFPDDISGYKTR